MDLGKLCTSRRFERGMALEAAEKGLISGEMPENHVAGAKAKPLFCGVCGTTEVVPCYKTSANRRFSGFFRNL